MLPNRPPIGILSLVNGSTEGPKVSQLLTIAANVPEHKRLEETNVAGTSWRPGFKALLELNLGLSLN